AGCAPRHPAKRRAWRRSGSRSSRNGMRSWLPRGINLGQDFRIVLPERRRAAGNSEVLTAHLEGRDESARLGAPRKLERLYPAHVRDLRIGERLRVGVDGRAGHARLGEGLQPVADRLLDEGLLQDVLQLDLVLCPQRRTGKAPVLYELVAVDHLA